MKNFETGTILKCSINKIPFVYHYGIVLNEGNNVLKVIYNSPKKNKYGGGLKVDRIEDFLRTRTIEEIQHSDLKRQDIINSVKKYVQVPFNLFVWNCEHYVTKVRTGQAQSPQIRQLAKFAPYLILIFISITKNPLKMKKETLFAIIAIIVFLAGGYYMYQLKKKKNENGEGANLPEPHESIDDNPTLDSPAQVVITQPVTDNPGNYWNDIQYAV